MQNLEFFVLIALMVWLLWRTRAPKGSLDSTNDATPIPPNEEHRKNDFELAKSLEVHYPFDLAVLYASGWGVEKDQNEALRLYSEAAKRGDRRVQRNLAYAYFEGVEFQLIMKRLTSG